MDIDNPLGRNTDYPKVFDPNLLFAIPRQQARQEIEIKQTLPFVGYDEWTLYELAWRDSVGSPQMAMGVLHVPANSEFIVESKSLKLYANGLYYQRFDSEQALIKQIEGDLNQRLNTRVRFSVLDLDSASMDASDEHYLSLDHIAIDTSIKVHAKPVPTASEFAQHGYKSRRFRSLCPVTGQPDWASIYLSLQGMDVEPASLAQYLAGYSEHQGFHENCVERIYMELSEQLQPKGLCVAARYTRRGGIDINPVRASSESMIKMPYREIRQ